MPRPRKWRRLRHEPQPAIFKPIGLPLEGLAQVDLLVRAWRDRQLVDEVTPLRATVQTSPVRGLVEIEVKPTPNRLGRTATCQVYDKKVKLKPPGKRPGLPPDLKPVSLWAVLIREMTPPSGQEPIEWLLLTTWQIASFDQACQLIQYYTRRGRSAIA